MSDNGTRWVIWWGAFNGRCFWTGRLWEHTPKNARRYPSEALAGKARRRLEKTRGYPFTMAMVREVSK